MNNTTVTYRVRTATTERLFDDVQQATDFWQETIKRASATIDVGRYQVINGRTVWVKA